MHIVIRCGEVSRVILREILGGQVFTRLCDNTPLDSLMPDRFGELLAAM
jgi:hypothetical protein